MEFNRNRFTPGDIVVSRYSKSNPEHYKTVLKYSGYKSQFGDLWTLKSKDGLIYDNYIGCGFILVYSEHILDFSSGI